MCGICGAAGRSIDAIDMAVFSDLLMVSVFRGRDATGVAYMATDKGKPRYFFDKDIIASPIYTVLKDKQMKKMVKDHHLKALIGHARWATVGEKKKENAHPFNTEKLLGVHNGTVFKTWLDDADKYETDSEALLNMIDKKGLYAVIDEIRDRGAYALAYYEKKTGDLVFYRNDQRTLYFAYDKSYSTLFWASEEAFLTFVLDRHDVAYEKPWALKPHTMFSIPMMSKTPFKDVHVEEFKFKPLPVYQHVNSEHWRGHRHVGPGRHDLPLLEGTANAHYENEPWFKRRKKTLEKIEEESKKNFGPMTDKRYWNQNYRWDKQKQDFVPRNEQITKEEADKLLGTGHVVARNGNDTFFMVGNRGHTRADYEDMLKKGCAWCTQQAEVKHNVRWNNGGSEYLCIDCRDNTEALALFAA